MQETVSKLSEYFAISETAVVIIGAIVLIIFGKRLIRHIVGKIILAAVIICGISLLITRVLPMLS